VGRYGIKGVKNAVTGKWEQSRDSLSSNFTENRSLSVKSGDGGMLGAKGTQTNSTSVWRGSGKERIDVENPAPGVRAGQVHYQDNSGAKYYYQPQTGKFTLDAPGKVDAPKSVQKLLDNKEFLNGINKALRYLGETK
jgi:filamentous hemagglutinin